MCRPLLVITVISALGSLVTTHARAQWYSSVAPSHERSHVKRHLKRDVNVVREKSVVVVPTPRPTYRSGESPPTSLCPSTLPASSPPRTWADMSFEEKWNALICTMKQPKSYQGN